MKLSRLSILVYSILFLGSFLIGSFGFAPMLEVHSQTGRIPYMISIVLGYALLAAWFVFWYRGDLEKFINKYFMKELENNMEKDLEEETSLETQECMDSNEINDAIEESIGDIDEEERQRSTTV